MLKFRSKFFLVIVIILTIFLFTYGYLQNLLKNEPGKFTKPMDISWLNDSSCEKTCFYSAEVGKTSEKEALNLIAKMEFLDPDSIEVDSSTSIEFDRFISFDFINHEYYGIFYFIEDKLQRISLGGVSLDHGISNISSLIEYLGFPDFYLINRINPEGSGCQIEFFWESYQLIARASDENLSFFQKDLCTLINLNKGKISGDLIIRNILLTNESWFEKYFDKPNGQEWQGFIND